MQKDVYQVCDEQQRELFSCLYRDSLWFRFRGLMLRADFPDGHALLFTQCNCVHMFFVRFPIDVVFLSPTHEILRLTPHLKPWRCSPLVREARSVLECPIGTIEQHKLCTGQTLHFQ